MKVIKNKYLGLLIVTLSFILTSGNMKDDDIQQLLKHSNDVYATNSSFKMTIKYLFAKEKESKAKHSISSEFYRYHNGYYQQISDDEYIYNDSMFVYISHSTKAMYLGDQKQKIGSLNMAEKNYGQFLKYVSKSECSKKNQDFVIIFEFKKNNEYGIERTYLYIDGKTNFMHRVVLEFNTVVSEYKFDMNSSGVDTKYIDINYTNFASIKPEENKADISRYISVKKNKVSVSKRYQGYKLVVSSKKWR